MKIQDFPPKYQYPSTCTVQFSWFNAVRNNESYYLAWKDVAGTTRTTQSLPFGAILSIKTDVPNPVVTSANPTGFNVVRARDNKVVASKPSFRLDNQFSQMVVAWTDQQNNIFTDNVGMFGPYGQACAFGWNLAYPYSTVSNAITPNVTIVDNNNKLVSGATGTATYSTSYNNGTRQITSTTAYATRTQCWSPSLSTGIPGRAPVALPYQDISSYQFSCNYQSKPSLKVTVPNGNLIAVATSVFFICINDAQQQARLLFPAKGYLLTNQVTAPQAHPSLPSPNHDIFPVIPVIPATTDRNLDLVETSGTKDVVERRLQGSSLPGGYHVYYGYSTPSGAPARFACRDVTEATYYALGQCTQTGLQTSLIRSAVVSNGVTRFFGTDYASTNCDPSTAGLQRQSEGVDNTTVCQPSPQGTTLKSFGFTKTLPPLPAGQVAKYSYANAAQCAAGTAPLQATYSVPNRCIAYYGNAYQQNLCAANVTVTSSTGGFVVHRFYGDAACQAAPLVSHFHQLNVCGQSMDRGSFKYVPQKGASGSSVTAFMKMAYASDDCSGPLSTPPPGPTNATNFNTTTYTWQSNAMPAGDTSMVCSPSGLADPNMAYATVVYAPVVLGFSSGWGVGRFNSLGACNALDTTKLFGGKQYTAGCVQDADVASNFISVTGCPGVTTTPTTVTYTYAFQGVSLATAQSAAFQSNCILVVAAYAGVPAWSVSITSVVAQSGVVIVKVATTASNTNVAALNNLHRNAGPVIVNALGTAFPGLGLASVPAVSTGPPTPAAVSSALSSSGAALTASLAAAYPGIVVGNAVTTVTAAGVSATQNIPSGVTVAQAQTPAFQAAFVAVRVMYLSTWRVCFPVRHPLFCLLLSLWRASRACPRRLSPATPPPKAAACWQASTSRTPSTPSPSGRSCLTWGAHASRGRSC